MIRFGLENIWENNIGQSHVTNSLGNAVAMVKLEVLRNILYGFVEDGSVM